MGAEAELASSTKRRGMAIALIAGLVMMGFGSLLIYLGANFEEPAERISTRSVPVAAPIALMIGGALVALAGLVVIVRGRR